MFKITKDLQFILRLSCFRNITTSGNCSGNINVPQHIERDSTDILKALASTVKQDLNGPHYMYHDDPYLTPVSFLEKKRYLLSKESGRKAARFIQEKYHTLFTHHPDDPVVEKFIPKPAYDDATEPTEEILINSIQNTRVSEAITIYKACTTKDVELSSECLQSLLEFISFFNGEDAVDEEWLVENSNKVVFEKRNQKTWKDASMAEEIFNKISSEGSKPYCALIRGMCKYGQVERAWQLYQESLDKKISLDTETFADLITIVNQIFDNDRQRWKAVEDFLNELKFQGHPPTLSLMNKILQAVTYMGRLKESHNLSVMKEFKLLGIEPSLGSYFHLLARYRMSNHRSPILTTILDQIEGRSFTMRDNKDSLFFFKAMEIAHKNFQDWEICQRIHAMLLTGDNYLLIGESFKQSLYYRNYILQALESMPMGEFMEMFDNLVPNIHAPERILMEEIIKAIGIQDTLEYLPRIWSHLLETRGEMNEVIIDHTLMVTARHDLESTEDPIRQQLLNISWDIFTRIVSHVTNDFLKVKRIQWNGAMYGDCMSNIARLGGGQRVKEVVQWLLNNPNLVTGNIPVRALRIVIDSCKTTGDIETCINVLNYMRDHEYPETNDFAKDINTDDLTKEQRDLLRFSFSVSI